MIRKSTMGAILGAASLLAQMAVAAPPIAYDLIIRHGTVFDGSGHPGMRADVGIVGDRIVTVGDLSGARARAERDATGLYVTPGFVSVHDHSEPAIYGRPESLITQGVTTAIVNPDGFGPLDIVKQLTVPGGLGLNYGAYVGFGTVWQQVMGLEDRRPTQEQTRQMQALVLKALTEGAFGVSAGLDYKPAFWAKTDEVSAVASIAKPWRTNFPNHDRVWPGNGNSSMAGMAETVKIGADSGVMPVITHMKLQGPDHGKVGAAFAMFAAAERRGVHVGVDAYPYTFGQTSLEQLLIPNWAQAGGNEKMLERFKDPALRARIIAETNETIVKRWGGPESVYLAAKQKELTAYMKEMGNVSGGEAVVRLLERGERAVILRFGLESDQAALLAKPVTVVSCDCGAVTSKTGHPRNWGSFPRFLGRYVREQHLVSWGEAVRKMTALPAAMIGLSERGYLLPGMIADVTVFDPRTVTDRATIDRPTLPSLGIDAVIVNGQVAVDKGTLTGIRAGAPLMRSRHEPSRPMNYATPRSLVVDGWVGGVHARATVSQAGGVARPRGTIRVSGLARGQSFVLAPSLLQGATGWASATGIARWSDGHIGAVTLVAEQADPLAGGKPGFAVLADGKPIVDGSLRAGRVQVHSAR
jgi:N-acyl-D-amino-acid deacylase